MEQIDTLKTIAPQFDAIVLDQWGVLHDGSAPYANAVQALRDLKRDGVRLAVLSNSGKRAAPNEARITSVGFDAGLFETVMTSGEALWRDLDAGLLPYRALYSITRSEGDAKVWAAGLDLDLVDTLDRADAVLLMGLSDGAEMSGYNALLDEAAERGLPVLCTNPDRASPRGDGVIVASPGALAHDFADRGGQVQFYGKPHRPVFEAISKALNVPAARLLMVGDSLEHDIAGGHAAGWSTLFVQGGLHASAFEGAAKEQTVTRLAAAENAPLPDFMISQLG